MAMTESDLNHNVINASYAVRGPILDRANELQEQLDSRPGSLPFNKIVPCNIGNPQALGQQPMSFNREVLAMVMCPSLIETAASNFAPDAVARAKKYMEALKPATGCGAYTNSQGIAAVREEVCDFIERRDGYEASSSNVFITDGASMGVKLLMQTFMRSPSVGHRDGILCPIPQYPLYSALTTLSEASLVPYYLDEDNGWGLDVDALVSQLDVAAKDGISVRGLVVINPGNPTGQTLAEDNMAAVVQFCADRGIVLMADEVYQENIWRADRPFVSFKKVARDMGFEDKEDSPLKLVSFHSVSKGFMGECGMRGGYFELFGMPPMVSAQIYKLASICLCSNTIGQLMTGLMVNPPRGDDVSAKAYEEERSATLASLKLRSKQLHSTLVALEGVTCNASDGSMYAFPKLSLPTAFCAEAEAAGVAPDFLYCMRLLEATGIVVVPGSGFGQVDGSWHFRTTFLPPESDMAEVGDRLTTFHSALMDSYR